MLKKTGLLFLFVCLMNAYVRAESMSQMDEAKKRYFTEEERNSSHLMFGDDPNLNWQTMTFMGFYGTALNKLQLFINDAEMHEGQVEKADIDIFYYRPVSQHWAIKGGANYFYEPAETPYWQPGIGLQGLMAGVIETNLRIYYHASVVKMDLELGYDWALTDKCLLTAEIRGISATRNRFSDELGAGLNEMQYILRPSYQLMHGLHAFIQLEYTAYYQDLKTFRRTEGEPTTETALYLGLSLLI